jgi:polyhydroxyalkanoate synthesis regulator phasin
MKRVEDLFYLTVGALSMAKKSVENAVDELIEGKKVIEQISSKFKDEEDELYAKFKERLKDSLTEIGVATKSDLAQLKEELLLELKKN